jgi:hypothetical protein
LSIQQSLPRLDAAGVQPLLDDMSSFQAFFSFRRTPHNPLAARTKFLKPAPCLRTPEIFLYIG